MPGTYEEKVDSRTGKLGESAQFVYLVDGEDNPATAVALVLVDVPTLYDDGVDTLVLQAPTYSEIASQLYEVQVNFGKAQAGTPAASGTVTREFQVSLENVHINWSKQTVNSYPSAAAAPQDGAIGVKSDGTVEGVDVLAPVFSFSVTIRPTSSAITTAYRLLLAGLVGKVNSHTFEGHAPGEVLFAGLGGTSEDGSDDNTEIRLEFLARPNETNITVGAITGIAKDGWDYLWVLYEKEEKTVSGDKKIAQKAVAAYVERVYERANLQQLYIS